MKRNLIDFAQTFSSDAYFVVNKQLLRKFGPDTAIFLTNLIDKYLMLYNKGILEEHGGFFQTFEKQEEETGLTLSKLRTCKKKLIEEQILSVKMLGAPPKEWYYLNFSQLKIILYNSNDTSSINPKESVGLILKNPKDKSYENLRNINNNLNNNNLFINNTSDFPITNKKNITPAMFELFWKAYPKKSDKGQALTIWEKLCKKPKAPNIDEIINAINAQIKTKRWQKGYIPLPTTWLNQSRWLDDPAEMNVDFSKTPKSSILVRTRTGNISHKKAQMEI